MSIKVVLADDHMIVRNGLRSLLEQNDMEVVAEAEDGRTTVRLARDLLPDVVVMDIGMPDLNGIEATRQITAESPGVKVIGLSMHADKRFVSGMLSAGASGYLLKDCAFEELAQALRAVVASQTYLSPGINSIVVKDYMDRASITRSPDPPVLTGREREVLQLLAEGKTTKQIASQLGVSAKTIESHRQHIMSKLDLHSIAELTKYAIRTGLTSLEI